MCERAKQKGLAKVAEVEFVLRAEEVRHGLHWIMSSIYAYNVCRVCRIILLIILLSLLMPYGYIRILRVVYARTLVIIYTHLYSLVYYSTRNAWAPPVAFRPLNF